VQSCPANLNQDPMKMFFWKSEYLRQWGDGLIIVAADSETAARAIAWEEFWKDLDLRDEDDVAAAEKLFRQDLTPAPRTSAVLFIRGSA